MLIRKNFDMTQNFYNIHKFFVSIKVIFIKKTNLKKL